MFPYGTHIYREPSLPLKQLKKDLKLLKKLGFNMVKIQESWSMDEKKEGEIDLENIGELIEEAETLDLKVYFGVTMEQAPAWLWKKYPDCRFIYNDGTAHNDPTQYLLPGDGKPGPCWDHPGARKAGERFIGGLVKKLGRYKNILVWNVWQEVGFCAAQPGKTGFCFCPYTLKEFRKWLKGKYNSLENLNERWKAGYGEWDEVEPPRIYAAVPPWMDWQYFIYDVYLPRAIRWKADAFRKSDPHKRPVFCHMSGPVIARGAEWRFAREADIFGSSCYPIWGGFSEWDKECKDFYDNKEDAKGKILRVSISQKFDYIRNTCKDKKFWAAEFQGGPTSTFLYKGKTPAPEDIRRWVFTALSTGINGLCFWNHRAEILWQEAYGFGLMDLRGGPTDRAAEAGKIGKAINRHPGLFQDGVLQKNETAILINENLNNFLSAMSLRTDGSTAQRHLAHTIQGLYKMLWEEGIFVDFVDTEEMDRLKDYKVIILPFPLAISDEIMEKLKMYVAGGGVLLSECCPGRYDEYGFARSGEISCIAEELFGIEHKGVIFCEEPGTSYWTPKYTAFEVLPSERFSGAGKFSGTSILPSVYVEDFRLKGGKTILKTKDRITGVCNRYGKGLAYIVGTLIGHAGATHEDKETKEFLIKLLSGAGVKQSRCGRMLLRKKTLGSQEAWFLINPTEKPLSGKMDFHGFTNIEDLLEGPVNMDKPVKLEPFEVKVFIVERNF